MAATRNGARTGTAARNAKKLAEAKAEARANANVFDLDALSREDVGLTPKEPIAARLKGVTFLMNDPGDLDFIQASRAQGSVEGTIALFRHIVGDEALYDKIMDPATGPVEQWKLFALMQKWTEHYEFELRNVPESAASPSL